MRKILALLIAAVAALTLVSCGKNGGNAHDNGGYTPVIDVDFDIEATLKIAITTDSVETARLQRVIEEYNNSYPNVNVEIQVLQGESFNNALVLEWNRENERPGSMADMFLSNSEDMHPNIVSGIFLNLQPYIDAEVKENPAFLDDYYENMFTLGKENLDPEGDQYLIPRSADRIVTHINQRIFKQCFTGWKKEDLPFTPIERLYGDENTPESQRQYVPENGWTWQQFLDTCAALRDFYDKNGRSNQYLIDSYVTWAPVYYSLVKSAGAEIVDRNTGEIKVESLEPLLNEIRNELVMKRYIAPSGSTEQANYAGGEGCMMFHSAYASKYYESLKEEYNVTTFPMYDANNTPRIGTGIAGYAVSSRTLQKGVNPDGTPVYGRDLAWTFLRFMLSVSGQEAFAKSGMTTLPIRKDLANPSDNLWGKELMEKGVNMEAYAFGTEYCQPVDFYVGYQSDKFEYVIQSTNNLFIAAISNTDLKTEIADCRESLEYYATTLKRGCKGSAGATGLGAALIAFGIIAKKRKSA